METKQYWKGFITAIIVLGIIGSLTAVGFHSADEIFGGTFSGNYIFSGNVDFTGTTSGVSGSIPSGMIADFNGSSCPSSWNLIESITTEDDLTSEGSASASSAYDGSWSGANAFDNSVVSAWGTTNTGTPHWLEYTFLESIAINKITLNPNLNTATSGWGGVKTFNIEYFDGSSWIAVQSSLSCPYVDNIKQIYNFTNNVKSNRWRIYITETWKSGNIYASILELEMMGAGSLKCIKD